MAVMMQGFYWDCAKDEDRLGEWWNYVIEKIPSLGKDGVGFDSIWLPPISKGADVGTMGYDPYDYFDLGDFDQGCRKDQLRQPRGVGKPHQGNP